MSLLEHVERFGRSRFGSRPTSTWRQIRVKTLLEGNKREMKYVDERPRQIPRLSKLTFELVVVQ